MIPWHWRPPARRFAVHDVTNDNRFSGGAHGIGTISVAPDEGAPLHRDFDWFREWRLTDDCGSAYRMTGGGGDFRGALWTDFHVTFEPNPPESASALTVHVPAETPITVPLDEIREETEPTRRDEAAAVSIGCWPPREWRTS